MKKLKVVITGGDGDIAQAIKKVLIPQYEVYTPNKSELDVKKEYSSFTYLEKIKPDILINNAGYINPRSIKDLEAWDLYLHLDINLMGAMICTKHAILNGAKIIINIGSSAGIKGKKDWSSYCVSKAGLTMFTECLAEEGYEAITFSIGRTDTKMRRRLYPHEDKSTLLTPKDIALEIYSYLQRERPYKYGNGKNVKLYIKDGEVCIEML